VKLSGNPASDGRLRPLAGARVRTSVAEVRREQ